MEPVIPKTGSTGWPSGKRFQTNEELPAGNARTKSSMAKELSQIGFSKKSIERILHLKMTVEEIHENKKGG